LQSRCTRSERRATIEAQAKETALCRRVDPNDIERKETQMTQGNSRPSRIAAVAAAALAFALGGAALAQPGPGHHGHGFGGGPDMLAGTIARAKAQFDAAADASKAARDTARSNMQRVKDALTAELAKAEPNLAAVAAVGDDVQAQNQALRKQVRGQWLALYATFSPEQKAVVKQMIQNRVSRMEQFRDQMQQRWNQQQSNG
jgi:Spy/CpxP family protein refolding chaperone